MRTPGPDETPLIIACTEPVAGSAERRAPLTLRAAGAARLVGRDVQAWNGQLGSYGMGGYGFFGLRLAPTANFPAEWLILTLFAADNWLLLDGHWVAAHPVLWAIQRPLTADFGGDESWDDLSAQIVGARLVAATITDTAARFMLRQGSTGALLEVPAEAALLPPFGGTGEPRRWNPRESLRDAWVLSASGDLG